MKKSLSAIFALGFAFALNAQQNTTASGGEAAGSGGTVSYSVGQIDYNYLSGSNGSMNEGVQQPYELLTTFVAPNNTVATEISAFPNPASDFVTIKLGKEITACAEISDASGKLISKTNLSALQTNLDVKPLAAGIYFVSIISDNNRIKQFKLIKNK